MSHRRRNKCEKKTKEEKDEKPWEDWRWMEMFCY
jgi:hypothetical protein